MANRNEYLHGAYLKAHIYSAGNCGDITRLLGPVINDDDGGLLVIAEGNDINAAVALGQQHGKAGLTPLRMERLVATVDGMVSFAIDPMRGGVDLSASKAAMEDLAKVAEGLKTGTCNVTVDNMAEASAKQHNAGDLADMKAATQGLGVVTEKNAAPPPHMVTMVVSAEWTRSLGEVTEKTLMDDHRIATAVRSETGKTDADEVIEAVQLLARRDHAALALSLQIMPLNTTIKLRDDIRVALGFAEPSLPEWVKPGAWAFFPKGSGKGDYLQIVDIAHDNVIFRLPMERTLMCPNGVVRIAAQGLCELEWIIERANRENLPISQMVVVFERELAKGEALNLV